MQRAIRTALAPAPVGPYSQGVVAGQLLFTAGQIGIDPTTGKLVDGGLEAESRRALKNLEAILAAAGAHLGNVVKTTVFLTDIQEFKAFNAVYAEFFPGEPPARSAVAVAGLPAGARVMIEMVAACG